MGWFWTNSLMGKIESGLVSLTNYIWRKRRQEEKKIIDKIKHSKK